MASDKFINSVLGAAVLAILSVALLFLLVFLEFAPYAQKSTLKGSPGINGVQGSIGPTGLPGTGGGVGPPGLPGTNGEAGAATPDTLNPVTPVIVDGNNVKNTTKVVEANATTCYFEFTGTLINGIAIGYQKKIRLFEIPIVNVGDRNNYTLTGFVNLGGNTYWVPIMISVGYVLADTGYNAFVLQSNQRIAIPSNSIIRVCGAIPKYIEELPPFMF